MAYTYTAIYQAIKDNRFTDLTGTPTVTALDTAGIAISGATFTKLATGLYVLSVTQDDLEDVIFRIAQHADDQADFSDEHLMQEKIHHVADEIFEDTGTTLPAVLDAIKGAGWTDETLVAIKNAIDAGVVDEATIRSAVGLTSANLDTQLASVQADLDNPDQYKADVSSIDLSAIETALDEIKGVGWTDETLVAIKAVIDAVLVDTDTSLPALLSGLQSWIATETNSSASASAITQIKGDTWEIEISNVILDTNKQQFVVKRSYDSSDNSALLFIDNISGLIRANGSEADDPTKASLSYSASALKLTVNVDASITSELPVKEGVYGIQSITSGSVVSEPYMGTFNIIGDVVNASE